jgi:hypothetical protein
VRRRGGWIKGRDGTWMAGWKGGRWCCAVLYVGRKLAGSFWSLRRERLAGNREGRVAGRRRKSFVAFRSIAKHTRGRRDTRLGPVLWLRMMPAGLSDMQGLKAGKWGRAHRRRVETGGRLDDLNDENMICWTLALSLYNNEAATTLWPLLISRYRRRTLLLLFYIFCSRPILRSN